MIKRTVVAKKLGSIWEEIAPIRKGWSVCIEVDVESWSELKGLVDTTRLAVTPIMWQSKEFVKEYYDGYKVVCEYKDTEHFGLLLSGFADVYEPVTNEFVSKVLLKYVDCKIKEVKIINTGFNFQRPHILRKRGMINVPF